MIGSKKLFNMGIEKIPPKTGRLDGFTKKIVAPIRVREILKIPGIVYMKLIVNVSNPYT